jgi:hypothetical protein
VLTDAEDEGVVDREAVALRLDHIEVVALGVGCWVKFEEVVGWVGACVTDGEGEGERMRV